ncbi:hypothetical protein PISMIDRAFT_684326 [Pisolithus microcarpus 441]|uniref:Uncharacterized protein n=1 Tax=Pisolithus microcarpus 441 TaxID=765257 RepID=A0A0C9ZEC2_9AGAM|nr:hypothetical protein PISMIDRAFT_684326 [Pisolithus microcarpus 441]
MASSPQSGAPNHYDGPVNRRNYALLGAVGDTYSQTDQNRKHSTEYTGCPFTLCGHSNPGTTLCNVAINCGSAPEHLRVAHGIRDINRSLNVTCTWTGCGQLVLRNNFIRHTREVHLQHPRNNGGC